MFFTSDLHFNHKKIVELAGRPWLQKDNTDEIISRWNSKVGVMDDVYHLGDFAFMSPNQLSQLISIIERLNGNIHFIRGNHCNRRLWKQLIGTSMSNVKWVKDYHEMKVDGKHVVLCHYPMTVWNRSHYGSFMLHGHCHGSFQGQGKILDVGIDSHVDFQVFSWEEIKRFMDKREIYGPDHHKQCGNHNL